MTNKPNPKPDLMLLKGHLKAAFNTWRDALKDVKQNKAALRHGIMKMRQSKLASALLTWRLMAAVFHEDDHKKMLKVCSTSHETPLAP